MTEKPNCPCGSNNSQTIFFYDQPPEGETAFDIGSQAYHRSYEKCSVCGHFVSVTDMDLGFMYDGAYVDQTYGDKMQKTFERIISLPPEKSDNEGRVQYIIKCTAKQFGPHSTPALLDVGAGLCVFPWRMKKAGWDVTALDPDDRAATHARDVVGVKAISIDFMDLDPAEYGKFDMISFNKVLEHVVDPISMLSKASILLKPNGIVYVEVPDVAAAIEGKGREEFFIEHHHVFSLHSVGAIVECAKLKILNIERLREPSKKYTIRALLNLNRI